MTIRKLTDEERKLTKKGLKLREKELQELVKEKNYFSEFQIFNEKWKDYLVEKELKVKERKEHLMIQTMQDLKTQVKSTRNLIETLKTQLNKGVEVKTPIEVN